ncbi:MAG: hypothetical protein L6Q57_05005 [Alphaproteobacteria bacterium]|nr:hypothetical protein [Alphaproteobacteria bacterium]
MTASNGPLTISGMIAANAQYEPRVRDFLATLITDAPTHARFLNMLSMLEHRGSRKIMLSQMDGQLDEETLKHLAEEARHAYFFKRQAERIGKQPLPDYTDANTIVRVPALMYFARLDAGISKQVPKEKAYPWVSLIVELRACWLYGIYQEVLQAALHTLSLKSLLAEEDMHLAEMYDLVGSNHKMLRDLSAYETHLFAILWPQIENAVGWKTPLAAA